MLSVFSTLWPYDPTTIDWIWTHHWTQWFSTCSGSSANGPDNERQLLQASWQPFGTDRSLAASSLLWIVWAESRWHYHSANIDCSLWFLGADRVMKLSSCGSHLLGTPTSWLVSDIPCYVKSWSSIWKWYEGSDQDMLQLGFAEHQLEVTLWHWPYPDQWTCHTCSKHQLTAVAGSMLRGAANHAPDCQH